MGGVSKRVHAGLAVFAALALGAQAAISAPPADSAPTLGLPGLDGVAHSLGEWRGKVLLINFWASWCAPCQYEIPELVEWQNRHAAAGLQIIGVGVDDARKLRNVQRSLGINYPVLVIDPARAASLLEQWGDAEQTVPYSVVVDRSGRPVFRLKGTLDQEIFDENVRPLLGGKT